MHRTCICRLLAVAVTLQAAAALVPDPEACAESAALLLAQMPLAALQPGGALHERAAGEAGAALRNALTRKAGGLEP